MQFEWQTETQREPGAELNQHPNLDVSDKQKDHRAAEWLKQSVSGFLHLG